MRAVLNFYLTWKCNFQCEHCIHDCGPDGNHMTLDQMKYGFDFITWLKNNNIPVAVIGISGGEPCLHPEFWEYYMIHLTQARQLHNLEHVELHTNASLPVPDEYKVKFAKFFSQIFVGHDMFHRQFRPLSALYLQDYTDISNTLTLKYNNYLFFEGTNKPVNMACVRTKGRAVQSLKEGKIEQVSISGYPRDDCLWEKYPQSDCLYFTFTPDHVNHCGEKSHINPNATCPEGQFHPYDMEYDKLWHCGLDYVYKYNSKNCSQYCKSIFVKRKDLTNPSNSVSMPQDEYNS